MHGFWGLQLFLFNNTFGRFSFNFSVATAEVFGLALMPYIVTAVLLSWVLATYWSIKKILARTLPGQPSGMSLVFAVLIIVVSLMYTPQLYNYSFFWRPALLTYYPPLILFTIVIGIIMRRLNEPAEYGEYASLTICFFLSFIAGGFVETYGAVATVFFFTITSTIYLLRSWLVQYVTIMRMLFVSFLGSYSALIIFFLSPGNVQRQSAISFHFDAWRLIQQTLVMSNNFIRENLFTQNVSHVYLLVVLSGFLWFIATAQIQHKKSHMYTIKKLSLRLTATSALAFILIAVNFLTILYGYQNPSGTPVRTLIVPQFVLAILGALYGIYLADFIAELGIFRQTFFKSRVGVGLFFLLIVVTVFFHTNANVSSLTFTEKILILPFPIIMIGILLVLLFCIVTIFNKTTEKTLKYYFGFGILLLLIVIGQRLMQPTVDIWNARIELKKQAQRWDRRDMQIRSFVKQGAINLQIQSVSAQEYDSYGLNRAYDIASYYHLNTASITLLPDPLTSVMAEALPTTTVEQRNRILPQK